MPQLFVVKSVDKAKTFSIPLSFVDAKEFASECNMPNIIVPLKHRLIKVDSEDESNMYYITEDDYHELRCLFAIAEVTGDYPEESIDILNKYTTPFEVEATISTCGDGWGWYEPQEETS